MLVIYNHELYFCDKKIMYMPVSETIRRIREAKGFKQDYVATQLNITQQAYSKLEKKPEMMTLQRLKDLSKILQVSIVTLIGEDNVFVQQNYNQAGGKAATQMIFNSETDNEKELYERLIVTLKDEISYLRSRLQ
jgi:transcriptional regulator with XRE-family HTH domain